MGITKGPWIATDYHQGTGWRVESDVDGYPNDGWVICTDMIGPDAAANAQAIAALPELVEVLREVLRYCNPLTHPTYERARDILARLEDGND